MSTLSISQVNRKKVSTPGLWFSLSDLKLTVLADVLINAIACRWLTLNTQCQTLCMTLVASCCDMNVLMGHS